MAGRNLCVLVLVLSAALVGATQENTADAGYGAQFSRQATGKCFTSSDSKSGTATIACTGGKSDDCCVKRCKDGKCSCGRDSDFCRTEADCCSFAKRCVDNKCVCNGPGGPCTENGQCCSKKCTKKVCECSAIKSYCGETLDCCVGGYCSATTKKCVKMVDVGGSCKEDVECASGKCSGGVCACSPAKGPCYRKADCCPLAGKPPEAVGCVNGACDDCVPSSIFPLDDRPDFCDQKGPAEACCIGRCKAKNNCDYPTGRGGYCVGNSECASGTDTCVKNKCTLTNCLPNGSDCENTKIRCCSGTCHTEGSSIGPKTKTCQKLQ